MRVDCEDCSLNFQTKKLYIKHIKSKECTKSKRTKSPTLGTGQPSKKPRLEIIPQANYSPAQITQIQSQISQLTQKQKEQLQQQLSQKHKQVLQSIPLNQLASRVGQPQPRRQSPTSSRVIITKNGERKEVVAVGPGLSVTTTSGSKTQNKSRRTYSRNSVQEVRLEDPEDDLPLITVFTFPNESIAVEDADDEISIVSSTNPICEGEPVSYGHIKVKEIGKAFLSIPNVIQPAPSNANVPSSDSLTSRSPMPTTTVMADPPASSSRPITPTATPKETCPHCRKIFSKSGMSQHIEYKHKTKCDHCDQRYPSDKLQDHIEREHKLKCKLCPLRFLSHDLSIHVSSVHMTECKKCNQRYHNTEIDDHVKNTHEREVCPECPQRFETTELLENHKYDEHFIEHCEECPKRFKEVEKLVDHSITEHPKEQCSECDRVFGLAKDLDTHKEEEHSKIMKFNGGMFMMMIASEEDNMEVEEEDVEGNEEKERRVTEIQEEERQRNLKQMMGEIVTDLANDLVKNAMTGTILFALRFDN